MGLGGLILQCEIETEKGEKILITDSSWKVKEKMMQKQWRVLVTGDIPEVGVKILERHCAVEINTRNVPLEKKELMNRLHNKQALCSVGVIINGEIMDSATNLRIIANYGVGYDNIDIEAATKRGIMVTNTPEVLAKSVAEMTWSLLLCLTRRIVEADNFVRLGKFKWADPKLFLGTEIAGKILGVVGGGKIGTEVARRSQSFDMKILYCDLLRNKKIEEMGAKKVELDYLLKNADFVSLHVPLTRETRHLIGERELGSMKRTAYLINTSRGPIVNEAALVKALKEERIAGAALDVYEREPKLTEGLSEMNNVVLTPHLGSATYEAREKMSVIIAENCIAALKGERPPNLVNPEVLEE